MRINIKPILSWITEFLLEGLIYALCLFFIFALTFSYLGTPQYISTFWNSLTSLNFPEIFNGLLQFMALGLTSVMASYLTIKIIKPTLKTFGLRGR